MVVIHIELHIYQISNAWSSLPLNYHAIPEPTEKVISNNFPVSDSSLSSALASELLDDGLLPAFENRYENVGYGGAVLIDSQLVLVHMIAVSNSPPVRRLWRHLVLLQMVLV